MNSPSSIPFETVCREVRSRFPTAFAPTPETPPPAVEDITEWTARCPDLPGFHQVRAGGGCGSLEVLLSLVAETGARPMRMVWIDPADSLDPATAFERTPTHLLWARGGGLPGALRVADAILRDGDFPFVCLDGVLLPAAEWRRIPLSRWYRLQRLVSRRQATLLLWTPPVAIPAASRRWTLSAEWSFDHLFDRSPEELRARIRIAPADGAEMENRTGEGRRPA